MEPGMETRVSIPVVLVNRQELYAIVAVLGIAILGCVCVLGFSYSNFAKLKRNADEVRDYIASHPPNSDRAPAAYQRGDGNQSAIEPGMSDNYTGAAEVPFHGDREDERSVVVERRSPPEETDPSFSPWSRASTTPLK